MSKDQRLKAKLPAFLLTIICVFFPTVGKAEATRLGVVRNPENAQQWLGISTRLQATGVDYCLVDLPTLNSPLNLNDINVLLLPNVETLTGEQVASLQAWMRQGGKVIVTGPTGSLSQPQVRSQLRSLFGGYWGFPLSTPSTLQLTANSTLTKEIQQRALSNTLRGGVIIPTDENSRTLAVWLAEGTSPAVISTDSSLFLGWRWGTDGASSASLDVTWLQAVLKGYGRLAAATDASGSPCSTAAIPSQTESPRLPLWQEQGLFSPENRPKPSSSSSTPAPTAIDPNSGAIPRRETPNRAWNEVKVRAMSQELLNLIGRFESALLAANALNSNIEVLPGQAMAQYLETRNKTKESPQSHASASSQALTNAKTHYQNFLQLVQRQEYSQATEQWEQARRILWDNYPSDRRLAHPEIRAIWLDRGTIVKAKSEQDLAQIFDRLANAGINTVFFETVNASYPIYPSKVAPQQNPLIRGWDPLKAAVKLAHERGMELHAWVWMFAAANQRHNTILNQSTNYLGPVLSAHPDWAIRNKQGNIFHPNSKKAFLDPANPKVRQYLLSLLTEIATEYDVDGIQLDYIRYPFQDPTANHTYGYGVESRRQFLTKTGVDPINVYPRDRALWKQWTDFRIQQIDSFVATVSQELRAKRPDLILSAAVFALPRSERLAKLQQNWEEWSKEGYLDLVVPMTYTEDTQALKEMAQPLISQGLLDASLILPGVRLLNLPDVVALDQVQLLRDLPTGGYSLFAAENLNGNLQSLFNRTQGATQATLIQPLPHRQPFETVLVRYQSLQREWLFLLENNQLAMEANSLQEWGKQVDAIALHLDKLT
ncbi:MAG: glycoside hydrolase family 10 protein, partial [Chroococcales cyanobacterium]